MEKYRICLLCDGLSIGGAETHVVTLANALASRGHTVTLISRGGVLEEALRGVKHVTLPLGRKWTLPYCYFRLLRFFGRNRFDVIHAHTRLSALLCRFLSPSRTVCTAHWVFDTRFPKRTLSFWGRETLAVSDDIADYLTEEYGIAAAHIKTTINGIDTRRFYPQKAESRIRKVVYCSRFDSDRADAAFHLLAAAERLASHFSFSLVFIGDGNVLPQFRAAAACAQERQGRLTLTVAGAQSDVAPFLRDADVFVGVSRAALEGMASGCAVVLAGNEGMQGIFDPSNAARAEGSNFCCRGEEPSSPARIEEALRELLSLRADALRQMGEANRDYVLSRYADERMANDALSVYRRVARRRAVLCGYYGFGNIGDTLLSEALTRQLRKEGYGRVFLLSARIVSLRALYALWRGYDFFLGGGNLLQDGTSRRSLFFYSCLCRLALRRGCRLYLPSAGIGPLSARSERTVRLLLSRAEGVFCRTRGDLFRAKELGAKRAHLSSDAVLSLPFPHAEKKRDTLLFAFRQPKKEEEGAILAFLLCLLRRFPEHRAAVIALHPSDLPFSKRICHITGAALHEGSVKELLSLLPFCLCAFGTRLHLGICALGAHVPFFLSGDEKCRDFIEDIHALPYPTDFCGLFSYSDRPSFLPSEQGMRSALLHLAARSHHTPK